MANPNTIHVDIVSAEGEIFSGAASMVFAPASQGDLGIAPKHAPLLTLLKAGEVRVQTPDGQEQQFFVGGGAIEIQPNKVTVLADTALLASLGLGALAPRRAQAQNSNCFYFCKALYPTDPAAQAACGASGGLCSQGGPAAPPPR